MSAATFAVEAVRGRMEELGLTFMAEGFESFLGNPRQADETLLDSIRDLVDLEYIARKERTARTRLKLSGMPQAKRLDDFDLS